MVQRGRGCVVNVTSVAAALAVALGQLRTPQQKQRYRQ